MIVRCVRRGSTSRKIPSRWPCRMMSRTATKTAFIMPKVSGSRRGAPEASSRSMMDGNPGAGGGLFDNRRNPGVGLLVCRCRAVRKGAGALPDGAEHLPEDLDVEGAFAPEVVVEHGFVDMGSGGDAVHAGGVVSAFGKLLGRGAEDGVVRVPSGAPPLLNQLVS